MGLVLDEMYWLECDKCHKETTPARSIHEVMRNAIEDEGWAQEGKMWYCKGCH